MYLLHLGTLSLRDESSMASRDVSSGSTRNPLAMVFVGCILGFAFLAFVMRHRNTCCQINRPDAKGSNSNIQRYSDWKRAHSRSSSCDEDHLEQGNIPSEWDVTVW
ncbi:hypothetical protein BKA64DRAFT_637460 [Cadophora sp. MPI-SDFR-AT-0126]|nr:hypothetical protein BKA64DRAFT_637460 [Leotiomycetes sp. MPI-SDFR-AT-0126]